MNLPRQCFSELESQLIENKHFLSYLNSTCAIALKVAKILTAQASAQPFKNNCGSSAIASK